MDEVSRNASTIQPKHWVNDSKFGFKVADADRNSHLEIFSKDKQKIGSKLVAEN